jgi:hypothetical protein
MAMAIDFEQFAAWRDGKRVRIKFLDGEVAEVAVVAVALPNEYDNTPESWGVVYDVISTNRPRNEPKSRTNWSRLDEIESFEIIEEGNA